MIASLVIVLPFAHIGGRLVINHNNKTFRFETENIDSRKLQCLAFYADCHHEVEEVKHGYRLALTYNLVLESSENPIDIPENKQLEKALEAYFVPDMAGTQKLIYFLDHGYTEHSLKWNMLKGVDRQRALNFRSAANTLGLIPHLALVEIHETWAADGDEDDPDPGELIDDSTTLSYWVDANDHKLPYGAYSISKGDACWTKDTDGFSPFNTEYEGYMGNYGNTVDYWYRRAAVVLWPASDQAAMMFKLNYDAAFKDLMVLTKYPGNEKSVLEVIKKARKSLYGYGSSFYTIKATEFKHFARIAAYIQDQDIAKSVLEDFSLDIFDEDGAEGFVNLQNLYGVSWCLELIELWKSQRNGNSHFIKKDFDQVVVKLLNADVDRKIALYLLDNQINYIIKYDKDSLHQAPIALKKSMTDRIHALKNLIDACDVLNDTQKTQKLVSHVISNTALYPEYDLGSMIVEEKTLMEKNHLSVYFLLRDHAARFCSAGVRQFLAFPPSHVLMCAH